MKSFVSKYAKNVIGTLSGFDRLVFRGSLRSLSYVGGMKSYLYSAGVLLKDFAQHVETASKRLKESSLESAQLASRPVEYLQSSGTNKEEVAKKIAEADRIKNGLICILTSVEQCKSYDIFRNREKKLLELVPRQRKCLHIYHYLYHPTFGFMNARIQTWFPFNVQICINGREWLSRQMDEVGLGYQRKENCFTWLEDSAKAQQLMAQQVRSYWPTLLDGVSRMLNPIHSEMFTNFPVEYYWSTFQSEWATDIMFRNAETLGQIYPRIVQHGLTTFSSPDVMRFLGRKISAKGRIPPAFRGEVVSDVKERPEGVRIKHRVGGNSVKLYDKQGSVLRAETTINNVQDFKVFRHTEGKPEKGREWLPMRKGIADLYRRTEVSQAANDRYLEAISSVEDSTKLSQLVDQICHPTQWQGRRSRALNPHAPDDSFLLEIVSRGEFTLNGFRNRDIKTLLFPGESASAKETRRRSSAVTRKLRFLRAHGLIKKVPKTHRYLLTDKGRTIITTLLTVRNASAKSLMKLAA